MVFAAIAGLHGTSQGDAVQWSIADGGNGHWYRHDIVPYAVGTELCGIDWAIEYGATLGGYPVTITSPEENQHVLEVLPYFNGAYSTAKIGCEKSSGSWQWVTGEPFKYDNFIAEASSNMTADLYDEESSFGPGWRGAAWCSYVEVVGGIEGISVIVEWSADCNGDGIVDHGQILDGTLFDTDANGVPDCCDDGVPCDGSQAVQWPIEDGGNGHWYVYNWDQSTDAGGVCWWDARDRCLAIGGDLVAVSSPAESEFIGMAICPMAAGANGNLGWLGLMPDGAGGLIWSNGEPYAWSNWGGGQPSGDGPHAAFGCELDGSGGGGMTWNDIGGSDGCHTSGEGGLPLAFWITEYSADCNGDGIVDFGQIRDGSLSDDDGNGIPDVCQCTADFNGDGIVGVNDLLIVMAQWGTPGPLGDADQDGQVNVTDVLLCLQFWGGCS